MTQSRLRIAIMGVRGVPARFGGSETVAEEIGSRLVERGHKVVVYCHQHNSTTDERFYKGMERVVLPSINTLSLDTPTHTLLSILHLILFNKADVIHFHGVGNAFVLPLLKVIAPNKKSIVVVDGPDWERPKWRRLVRLGFKLSFRLAVKMADAIISDNKPVQRLFRERYGRETVYVPYGADLTRYESMGALEQYGLEPDRYILFVGALVPDKGHHVLIEAFERLKTDMPLVIVGDTPYALEYKRKIQSTKDPRIRFLGYVYGKPYRELLNYAHIYVHPLIVDGTSPALLQAMAAGNCVVASNLPETMDVVGDAGFSFRCGDAEDLRRVLRMLLENPALVQEYKAKARQRIVSHFSWDRVTDEYEALSYQVLHRGSSMQVQHEIS